MFCKSLLKSGEKMTAFLELKIWDRNTGKHIRCTITCCIFNVHTKKLCKIRTTVGLHQKIGMHPAFQETKKNCPLHCFFFSVLMATHIFTNKKHFDRQKKNRKADAAIEPVSTGALEPVILQLSW